jgi:hypothetical protein
MSIFHTFQEKTTICPKDTTCCTVRDVLFFLSREDVAIFFQLKYTCASQTAVTSRFTKGEKVVRECHQNFAHGPMKIKTETVEMKYRGEIYHCDRTVYACTQCDFELEQQWMKDKREALLEKAYAENHS